MSKGKTVAGIFILSLVVVALLWKSFYTAEPEYHGKPLSYWVLRNARPTDGDQLSPAIAIAEMGTNAAPFLIKWIGRKPYNWQRQLRTYRNASPLLRKCIPFWATGLDKENRALAALTAIQCLGPAGRGAIPKLVLLANNITNYSEATFAFEALRKIGPEAVPALLTLATNQQLKVRQMAIYQLSELRSPATLPTLIQCLSDQNPSIVCFAAGAVGAIRQQPADAVPALIRVLERAPPSPKAGGLDLRSASALALKEFGTNADSAVPQLQSQLASANENDYRIHLLITTLRSVSAHPERTVTTLAPFLQSTNEALRRQVVDLLATLGQRAESALPSLTNALQFEDTRRDVEYAIQKITLDSSTKHGSALKPDE